MQYIFLLAKPLLCPHVRRHGGVDLTYEYVCLPALVAVVGHIENTLCTGSVGGMVEPRKFPISAKISVQVHEPAGLFLRKEPTAPLDKRLVEYQKRFSPNRNLFGRPVPSQSSSDLCLSM
jgi:hypothetical protein